MEYLVEDLFGKFVGLQFHWVFPVVYNVAIDSAIVGLVIGVRFVETQSW